MARNVQAQLEAEADRKGLTGERRKAYIGGAWQDIRFGHKRREWWRHTDEYRALGALVGTVEDMRTAKGRPDAVYFRQGREWYELPHDEYERLTREGRKLVRELDAHKRREEREIARYHRELAKEEADAKRRQAREAAAQKREEDYQRKALHAVRRAEHAEVLDILRDAGGVKLHVSGQGHIAEKSEYNRLPSTIKAGRGSARGLTPDQAREAVAQHMPWLKLETVDDFYQYFEGVRDWRRNKAN